MGISIDGMGNISPQQTWNDEAALLQAFDYRGNHMYAVEPDYTPWIDSERGVALPKLVKMSIAAANIALSEARIRQPDGIITGSGLGCQRAVESLLSNTTPDDEADAFSRSQYEALGYQLAHFLQCNGYSQVHTQDGFSFESALLDAMMRLNDDKDHKILVGGVDEFTETSNLILSRMGLLRKKLASTLRLFKPLKRGTIQGEGACYFVLSGKLHNGSQAELVNMRVSNQTDPQRLQDFVEVFIRDNGYMPGEIDLILTGKNGDKRTDLQLDDLCRKSFPAAAVGLFKHLCGEYPTASAFALWLAVRVLKERHVPEVITFNYSSRSVRNILVVNAYLNTGYSVMLLRSCHKVL
jgi:3-oxoacyl-[acyl-carrier-protein] synthase II